MIRGGRVEVLTAWIAPRGNDSSTTALHSDLGMATQWKTKHMTKQGAGFSWKGKVSLPFHGPGTDSDMTYPGST